MANAPSNSGPVEAPVSVEIPHGEALQGIDRNTLIGFGAKVGIGDIVATGQWWRLVTAGFLHGGILHILIIHHLGGAMHVAAGNGDAARRASR